MLNIPADWTAWAMVGVHDDIDALYGALDTLPEGSYRVLCLTSDIVGLAFAPRMEVLFKLLFGARMAEIRDEE